MQGPHVPTYLRHHCRHLLRSTCLAINVFSMQAPEKREMGEITRGSRMAIHLISGSPPCVGTFLSMQSELTVPPWYRGMNPTSRLSSLSWYMCGLLLCFISIVICGALGRTIQLPAEVCYRTLRDLERSDGGFDGTILLFAALPGFSSNFQKDLRERISRYSKI